MPSIGPWARFKIAISRYKSSNTTLTSLMVNLVILNLRTSSTRLPSSSSWRPMIMSICKARTSLSNSKNPKLLTTSWTRKRSQLATNLIDWSNTRRNYWRIKLTSKRKLTLSIDTWLIWIIRTTVSRKSWKSSFRQTMPWGWTLTERWKSIILGPELMRSLQDLNTKWLAQHLLNRHLSSRDLQEHSALTLVLPKELEEEHTHRCAASTSLKDDHH